jgi:hypothetical protein
MKKLILASILVISACGSNDNPVKPTDYPIPPSPAESVLIIKETCAKLDKPNDLCTCIETKDISECKVIEYVPKVN